MTKSTITRERLQEIAEDGFLKHGESKELARMALVAMDSEPFAYIIQDKYERERGVEGHLSRGHVSKYVSQEDINEHEITCTPLYRHAQPAPVVVPVKIPGSVYQVIYQECGGFVDCDANTQTIWDACRAAMLNGGKS